MKTYICEICGDAYIGETKPTQCPFCGAHKTYIKEGYEAKPIIEKKENIGELSKKNLQETLDLEMKANAVYLCMAEKTSSYELKAMYKRLAKIELEHATIASKLLNIPRPESKLEQCSNEDIENFKKTIELEEHASQLYLKFTKETEEEDIKMFFTALNEVEMGHIDLIKNYL